ncbi:DNA polymerase nu [Osmerus mordax]|uniref:DNA polymerase nu n=1 Tax=Osmerus mordax TaxID=8014 RepID=UPI00350F590E
MRSMQRTGQIRSESQKRSEVIVLKPLERLLAKLVQTASDCGSTVSLQQDGLIPPPLLPRHLSSYHLTPQQHSTLIPTLTLKRKHRDPSSKPCGPPPKISLPRRAPVRWEPPRPSQTRIGEGVEGQHGGRFLTSTPKHPELAPASTRGPQSKTKPPPPSQTRIREGVEGQDGGKVLTSTPKHPNLAPASTRGPRRKTKTPCNTGGPKRVRITPPNPIKRPPAMQRGSEDGQVMERECGSTQNGTNSPRPSKTPKTSKLKPAKPGPENPSGDPRAQSKVCLTAALTCDPRVKDAGKLGPEERGRVLEEARRARALVLTMVFQDGTTQLDPEQKSSPAVCGLLVVMRADLEQRGPEECGGPQDSVVYLRLEHTPAWAQQHQDHTLDLFTRELLLQVVSGAQLVVCYKSKDFLRTVLQHYRAHLSWKQVWGCRVQDPQVCAWLLDPADPASCYQDLLSRHCRVRAHTHTTPALGTRKVSLVISSLNLLYKLNTEIRSKLKAQGLWKLYTNMEISMIPVLAAMESHRIHVDKEALKRTSEMLGTKLKQLEQEAHQAAGQMFLVSSCTQLRTVLFDKLRLHERCDNKKLPKTLLTQQQSTSEAALLLLQDLHPLPKIILEYRQIHKVKSTFVDGILSCMVNKNLISSTWHQTSAVTGRITAKNPNFQALPRQPIQITKKQYIQEKEAEVVAVHPRAMFIPQDGWTFLAADFCQVELRLLAHLSSDPELLKIFSDAQADVFSMLASQWKGVGEKNVSSEEREHAKRIVYSVVYGAGRERLSGILGVSAEQASLFQDSFLQTYKEVQAFIQRTIQQCHKQGYVVSIMGRRRSLPLIHSSDWGVRMQAERQAVNFVVQGSAADLCKMAMIRIFSQISSSSPSARLLAQIHDELLYEVQDSQVEEVAALVKTTMESLQHIECLGVHLKVPLKVLLSRGKSWGSMSELNLPPTSPSPSL